MKRIPASTLTRCVSLPEASTNFRTLRTPLLSSRIINDFSITSCRITFTCWLAVASFVKAAKSWRWSLKRRATIGLKRRWHERVLPSFSRLIEKIMSQAVKEESTYAASFRALQENAGASDPSWIQRLRESAFARFEELGFPATAQEEWKYTNVAPIAKANFEPAFEQAESSSTLDAAQLHPFVYQEARRSQLVFVNGFYRRELSSVEALPENVVAINVADALKDGRYADVLREQLARTADYNENAFTALNTAFLSSGAFLLIPKVVQVES